MYLLFEKEKKAGKCVSIHLFLCAFSIFAEIKKKKKLPKQNNKMQWKRKKKEAEESLFFSHVIQ